MRLENDPEYARRVAAKATLKADLRSAKNSAQSGRAREFFESACSGLQNAISLAGNMQAKAVTLSDAERILTDLKFEEEVLSDVKTFFEGADAVTYGGQVRQTSELNNLYKRLEEICSQISQK